MKLRRLLPLPLRRAILQVARPYLTFRSIYLVFKKYGYFQSRAAGIALDQKGDELPWFTYPAIEYLRQLDFSRKTVFEFGAGQSTIFWSRLAAHITSVENNRDWYSRVISRVSANVDCHLVESAADYPRFLAEHPEEFDVIVVDGIERRRCCEVAVRKLKFGGVIILDNSDWHHHCSEVLRSHGLIEVDMTGFGPINDYTWTTSFYFSREFAFLPRENRQPTHGIGSLPQLEGNS